MKNSISLLLSGLVLFVSFTASAGDNPKKRNYESQWPDLSQIKNDEKFNKVSLNMICAQNEKFTSIDEYIKMRKYWKSIETKIP